MYQITYNGTTLDTHFVVNQLDLSDLPIRTSSQVLTGLNGGVIWNRLYNMKTITIGGSLWGSSASDYYGAWRTLNSLFNIGDQTAKTLSIFLDTGETRNINCKVIDMPAIGETEGEQYTATFQVILQAENPYFTDTTQTSIVTPFVASGFPLSAPLSMPLGGSLATSTPIIITGDQSGYPVFTINPTVTNPVITNQSTGDTWSLQTTVNATTGPIQVWQDQQGLHVGSLNQYVQYFTGNMFKLPQGTNIISFSGANITNSTLNISYWNEYVSI